MPTSPNMCSLFGHATVTSPEKKENYSFLKIIKRILKCISILNGKTEIKKKGNQQIQ